MRKPNLTHDRKREMAESGRGRKQRIADMDMREQVRDATFTREIPVRVRKPSWMEMLSTQDTRTDAQVDEPLYRFEHTITVERLSNGWIGVVERGDGKLVKVCTRWRRVELSWAEGVARSYAKTYGAKYAGTRHLDKVVQPVAPRNMRTGDVKSLMRKSDYRSR